MFKRLMSYLAMRATHEIEEEEALIQFLCEPQDMGVIMPPVPAIKSIPEWFKKIPAQHDLSAPRDHFGAPLMTAKKCLPMLDGMSVGYVIPLFGDMHVRTSKDNKHIDLTSGPFARAGDLHSIEQLGGQSSPTYPGPAIKFINRWVVKTRPGWSTLFLPAVNQLDKRFTCFAALVDTDVYPKQVNFPAVWHLPGYDGIVSAGTPLVTAIPVRRADIEPAAIIRVLNEEERQEIGRIERVQASRLHYYTHELRESGKS